MNKGIKCVVTDGKPTLKGFIAIKNAHIRETMSLEILNGLEGVICVGGQRSTWDRTLKAISKRTGKPKFLFHVTSKATPAFFNGDLDHLECVIFP